MSRLPCAASCQTASVACGPKVARPAEQALDLSRQEEERLGRVTRIRPGATAPLVVSWRTRSGEPAVVAYPGGTLKIPSG